MQNVDDFVFLALTTGGKELTLRTSRIEGIADLSLLLENRLQLLTDFFDRKWVRTELVEQLFGIDFTTGMKLFDFSRTAEWWSCVGKTDEERARNGQKITTYFRIKEDKHETN